MPALSTRLVYLSPEQSIALSPERARALFAARGAKALAAKVAATAVAHDPLALADALWGKAVPLLLADSLDLVARLGTANGLDALAEAAHERGTDTAAWDDEGPVNLVARILVTSTGSSGIVEHALIRLGRLPPERPTYELRAPAWRAVPREALIAALREVAGGPWSDVWTHEDDEGVVHAVLLYAAPGVDEREVRASGPVPLDGARRFLRADAFRFLPGDAPRLVVTTARPMRVRAYAAAWGRAIAGDEGFFLGAPSLTLKPLQALGSRGLARAPLPKGLAQAAVIACQLDTGDIDRVEARGHDALARLAPHLRAGGYLTRATVRFDLEGEEQPVDAIVELPNRLTIGRPDAAAGTSPGARLVRQALAGLGMLSPGAIADDVTSLLPLVHPEWRWRELAGQTALDAMREAGLFETVQGAETRRLASLDHRPYGRNAIAYRVYPRKVGGPERIPMLAEAYYAVAEDWAIPALSVKASAMDMLRLRLDAVVARGASAMGLARGRKVAVPRGALWVGDLRVESGVVRVFLAVRATTDDRDRALFGKAIARATGFGRAVVLVPRGRRLDRDFVEIELDVAEQLGAASWRARLAEAVAALGIEDEVPVELLVPEGVRLVVDTRRERVVLDGVVLVKIGESAYKLLRALAARGEGSEVVPGRELDRIVSGARGSDGAARTAAWKLKAWIEESFAEAGRDVPADVSEEGLVVAVGKTGWRLSVRGAVR